MRKLIFILFIFVITLVNCNQSTTSALTIATAANMQFAITEITEAFTIETGIDCQTIIG